MATRPGDLITVWLKEPMWGIDPANGDVIQSNRHRVLAERVIQDPRDTAFIDDGGAVVADWPTALVDRVVWDGVVDAAAQPLTSDAARDDRDGSASAYHRRLAEIKADNPRACERWPATEDEELRVEQAQGLSVREMAALHQRQPSAIRARLARLGLA